ncbi:hypothetical protein BDQ17DRAFT_1337940 [Cyathus striatus]|nr:hypothetical protein BDQ17DRAFT_1337940 [Cyathus striatus]
MSEKESIKIGIKLKSTSNLEGEPEIQRAIVETGIETSAFSIPSPPTELLSEDSDRSEVIQALANTLSQITLADLSDREREEEINPLPGPSEGPRTPPPAPPSDSDSEDEMAKGIPPPTSHDSPQWNGDGRRLKDWLRQLEMLYGEVGEKKQRLLTEYDPDEGEEYGSASKLERMARKQRLIGDGDFCEWKEFKRMFVDEAEKGLSQRKISQTALVQQVIKCEQKTCKMFDKRVVKWKNCDGCKWNMKESEINQVQPEGKVTLLQNAGGGMEPPAHLLQQMQQYSGWFEKQGWSVPSQMQEVMDSTCRQGGVKKPILTRIFNKSKEGGH